MNEFEIKPGRAYILQVCHDDNCPCLSGGSMFSCTCEETEQRLVDVSDPDALGTYLRERRS